MKRVSKNAFEIQKPTFWKGQCPLDRSLMTRLMGNSKLPTWSEFIRAFRKCENFFFRFANMAKHTSTTRSFNGTTFGFTHTNTTKFLYPNFLFRSLKNITGKKYIQTRKKKRENEKAVNVEDVSRLFPPLLRFFRSTCLPLLQVFPSQPPLLRV